jgi:asparagine synthetase A
MRPTRIRLSRRLAAGFLISLTTLLGAGAVHAAEAPDYKPWQELLTKYYDPAKGMNYKGLKEHDKAALDQLRQKLAAVDAGALSKPDQLAYWINLYNVSTVAVVVEG